MTANERTVRTRSRFRNRFERLTALLKQQSSDRTAALLEHLIMTEPNRRTLTEVLRAAITDSGLTFYALGKRSGVDQGHIGRFMRGERDLTLVVADKLAASLGLALLPLTLSQNEPESSDADVIPPQQDSDSTTGTARTTKARKTPALTPETTPKTADSLAPKKTPKVVGIVPGITPKKTARRKGDNIK